jgi:DNA-binding winged helix-turn-helix (wHTH) protein
MNNAEDPGHPLRFADLELDPERRTVRRDGHRLPVTSTSFQLLLQLLRRHPHTVTHRQLYDSVWPGRRVTADVLAQRIRLLRKSLGAAQGGEDYIVSVHGVGYRLALPPVIEAATPPSSAQAPARYWIAAGFALAAAVLLLAIAGPHPLKHFFRHLFS